MDRPVGSSQAKEVQLQLQAARKDELISFMELDGVEPLSVALTLTANEAARLVRVGQEESAHPLHDATRSLLAGLKNCMNFKDGLDRVSQSAQAMEAIVLAFAPDGSMASAQALQLLSVIAAFSEEALVCVHAPQRGRECNGGTAGPTAIPVFAPHALTHRSARVQGDYGRVREVQGRAARVVHVSIARPVARQQR